MPPLDLMRLNVQGQSLTGFGGPWIRPGRAQVAREEISHYLASGELTPVIGLSLPLAEAAEAHRPLEGRETVGKVLLTVPRYRGGRIRFWRAPTALPRTPPACPS